MREIKFRGKSIKTGEWIYGDLWQHNGHVDIVEKNADSTLVLPKTVGQFTGLKDKCDEPIYDGDILDFSVFDREGADRQYRGVVRFAQGQWEIWNSVESEFYGSDGGFMLFWASQDDDIEIIGNMYENAELLAVTIP